MCVIFNWLVPVSGVPHAAHRRLVALILATLLLRCSSIYPRFPTICACRLILDHVVGSFSRAQSIWVIVFAQTRE